MHIKGCANAGHQSSLTHTLCRNLGIGWPTNPICPGLKLYGSFRAETRTVSGKSGQRVTIPGETKDWLATARGFQCISEHWETVSLPGHLTWTTAMVRTRWKVEPHLQSQDGRSHGLARGPYSWHLKCKDVIRVLEQETGWTKWELLGVQRQFQEALGSSAFLPR